MDTVVRGWLKVRSGGGGRGLVFIEIHSWRTGVGIEGSILLIWNFLETGTLLVSAVQIGCVCGGGIIGGAGDAAAARWTALATAAMATCSDLTVVTRLWMWEAWVSDRLRPGPFCVSGCVCIYVFMNHLISKWLLKKKKKHFYFSIDPFHIKSFNWPKKLF